MTTATEERERIIHLLATTEFTSLDHMPHEAATIIRATATIDPAEVPDLDIDKVLHPDGKIHRDGILERRIVWNLFAHLAARDWYPRFTWDGEDLERVDSPKEAMEFIFNLDEVSVRMAKGPLRKKGEAWHGILLVLGNGVDILSDWNFTEGDPDGFSAAMDEFDAEAFV